MKPLSKNNLQRKRAITPLMATFLLVTFAVAIGVVIMNLGSAQIEETAECPLDIGMKLATIGGKEQLCYDAVQKTLSFTIENGVNANVEGAVASVIGEEKAETIELHDVKMGRAGNYVGKVAFDNTVGGAIRQVKISPQLSLKGEVQICPEQAVVVEKVENC